MLIIEYLFTEFHAKVLNSDRQFLRILMHVQIILYCSVSQSQGCDPIPGPGINYAGPREILLEFVILVF